MIDIEKVRKFFKNDAFAMDTTGITIEEVERGYAKCRLEIGERHLNAGGAVQGGAIFTLGDFAFAVASNTDGRLTVSVDSSISFISPPKGKVLFGEARKISAGGRMCFYEVEIKDDTDLLVARMSITGYIKNAEISFERL